MNELRSIAKPYFMRNTRAGEKGFYWKERRKTPASRFGDMPRVTC